MKTIQKENIIFPVIISIIFVFVFSYIFNPKIDLNGDNCDYFMGATSIATGHGYSNISNPDYPAISTFPIGYPLIMSSLRVFTDSIIAQKIFNGIFFLASIILTYFFMIGVGIKRMTAFIIGIIMIFNERVLHFSTMMMSELSFLFTSVLAIYGIYRMRNQEKNIFTNPWFYISLLSLILNYHIRTQGITLIAAVIIFFLFNKEWKNSIIYAAGFVIGLLPYMIRNKIQNLGQSRYLDTIAIANPWRPEEGTLTLTEVITRFFETLGMLITKALPNSVFPFFDIDYNIVSTSKFWAIGIVMITLIVIGYCRLKEYKWIFIFYSIFTFGIISIFSTPSGNRYITSILPFFTMGLALGIYTLFEYFVKKNEKSLKYLQFVLLIMIIPAIKPIQKLHAMNNQPFPTNYQNFFAIGSEIRKQLPGSVKVASRKPSLLYMYSRTPVCGYPYTKDTKAFVEGLLNSKADYIILDQLGYSSTAIYMLPAIQAYPDVFKVVGHLPNPDTYLFMIDKEKAREVIGK